jgi:hypothetical protein
VGLVLFEVYDGVLAVGFEAGLLNDIVESVWVGGR